MALSELAMLSLAWNLAADPSAADIQKYQSLSQSEQVTIQNIINQRDTLPMEIEKLRKKGSSITDDKVNHAPTSETSSDL